MKTEEKELVSEFLNGGWQQYSGFHNPYINMIYKNCLGSQIYSTVVAFLSHCLRSLVDNVLQDVINGPLPCEGKSDVEGYYDGPYYEWYRFNKVGVTITESLLHDKKNSIYIYILLSLNHM